jgi:hypothetical protein
MPFLKITTPNAHFGYLFEKIQDFRQWYFQAFASHLYFRSGKITNIRKRIYSWFWLYSTGSGRDFQVFLGFYGGGVTLGFSGALEISLKPGLLSYFVRGFRIARIAFFLFPINMSMAKRNRIGKLKVFNMDTLEFNTTSAPRIRL